MSFRLELMSQLGRFMVAGFAAGVVPGPLVAVDQEEISHGVQDNRAAPQPYSSRTSQTAMSIAEMSAVSPAATACRLFLMLTAPK